MLKRRHFLPQKVVQFRLPHILSVICDMIDVNTQPKKDMVAIVSSLEACHVTAPHKTSAKHNWWPYRGALVGAKLCKSKIEMNTA
jgi:hypothetical protein